MVNRISLSKVKGEGETTRGFVLFCCFLFLVAQSILPILTQNNITETHFYLSQSLPESLMLGTSPVQAKKQGSIFPPQFTPFFFKPVPLNSCDKNLLLSIRGIGPSIADAILKTRADIGYFHDMEDLLLVPGIGKTRMHQFSKHLSFENVHPVN